MMFLWKVFFYHNERTDRMNWIIDSTGGVNTVVSGKTYVFGKTHPHYERLIRCLRANNVEHFEALYDIGAAVEGYCQGAVTLSGGRLLWDGHQMPDLFGQRVMDMKRQGVDFSPMMNFLDNLADNPSDKSIVELFDFMQHKDLPITPDGHFLAYKAVRSDFRDKYSGEFDNSVGSVCEVSRSVVNADRDTHCGSGLHVGSIDYVLGYGDGLTRDGDTVSFRDGGDQVVVCKVNPRDVVSVPSDCRFQKLRACRYEVVQVLKKIYDKPVVGMAQPIMAQRGASPEVVKKIGRVSRLLAESGRFCKA